MQRFSLAAKAYIWGVIACGLLAVGYAYTLGVDYHRWPFLVGGCLLTIPASFKKILLFGKRGLGENNSTMSLGFVPTFFLLLTLGPFAGMLAGTINIVISTCYPRRSYYYQVLFSVAAVVISVLAAGMILRTAGLATGDPALLLTDPQRVRLLPIQVPALIVATLAYYLLNTFTVATAISLTTGKSPLQTWRAHFLWTGPGYFAGASCAAIAYAALVFGSQPGTGIHLLRLHWVSLAAITVVSLPFPLGIFLLYRYHVDNVEANERHIAELERKSEELKQVFMSTVESLALAIESKDRYTKEHILRVQNVAVAIAVELGLTGDDLQAIETGALLHDVGKLGIPEHILGKPGKLTDEEFAIIKKHPDLGAKILNPVHFPWPVMGAVRSHHERWDGTGYPDGLRGEDIPLQGRILAVADVYDALTSDRSYREGWPHERAIDYIRANAGSHFDPMIVQAFLAVVERSPQFREDKSLQTDALSATRAAAADTRDAVTEGINRASFESTSLYEISQTVSVTLDLHETLSLLAGKINNIFNASACVLFLSGENGILQARRAVGLNEAYFHGATTLVGKGMTGQAVENGEGVIGDYQRDDLLLSSSSAATAPWMPLEACLIAPLFADNRVVGTINLYHERAGAFDTEDLRVLMVVSAQAGRAIGNAREYEKTRASALTDSLTGLHNARYLTSFLEKELERAAREERVLSVLVMDLDNFKPVNDTFGHARGNDVLRDLGAVFQSVLRDGDLVARYAGDEFVVVLPGTPPPDAKVVVEKIRSAVVAYSLRLADELGDIRVAVSIGSASYPQDATDAASLLACADRAMYRDKNRRKGLSGDGDDKPETPTTLRLVA